MGELLEELLLLLEDDGELEEDVDDGLELEDDCELLDNADELD